jgi:glutamine---fructose-6-phosphate transaminase (isomerizing)
MCGIVGYVGPQEAQAILMSGLQRLEYRGYDSAGIAVVNGGSVQVARCEGKLGCLVEKVTDAPLAGQLGIGHTRWATHGRPSDINAHPHTFQRVTVVHNGIIENHRDIRETLTGAGHTFQSETDSEILAHLIDVELQQQVEPLEAIARALKQVVGVYAMCCLIDGLRDRFYCTKHDAPLILGVGEGENFVASDIPAILHHTRHMIFLEEGDVAEIRTDGVTLVDAKGTEQIRTPTTITWSPVMAEKEGHKHFMLKEILEQPRAIADTMRGRISPTQDMVNLDGITLDPHTLRRIFLVACGTSFHACMVGKYFIEQHARIPTEVDLASEFRYRDPIIGPDDLMIVVSQSGETADTKAALSEAKQKGASVLAITNVVDSAIPRSADMALYTHAGPEIGVASTKAFTTQLIAFQLIALYLAQQKSNNAQSEMVNEMMALPHLTQGVLESAPIIEEFAHDYIDASDWLFLGRGAHFPIALEGALKLKEISYAHAEGYAAGEMKHGPIALIDESLPVVGIALQGTHYEKMMSNLEEVKARGGQLIAIATEGDTRIVELADAAFFLPSVSPFLQPILSVLPLQLLAYYVADAKGTDVDQPRNLAKSVTVE